MDRRQHHRVPYGAWVENETREGGLQFYLACNLSLGGVLLTVSGGTAPAIGDKLRLRLVIENEARVMSVQGEVVRHAPELGAGGFAVRFINVDEQRKVFLRDLVGDPPGEDEPEGL